MANTVNPTKANLLAAKKSLAFSKSGYELLDRKRNILVRETVAFTDTAKQLQAQMYTAFQKAYQALRLANITLGDCNTFAQAVPVDTSLTFRSRSVMGVEIPMLSLPAPQKENFYGFAASNSYLDEAFFQFQKAKELAVRLAQIENSVYRLATAISKTGKRANALKNIVIPRYEQQIAHINEVLEEKDLEEHSRLKVIKKQKTKE
ncbi:MAG: V-type ATP synthase subunit D [Clostridia bacterium]|nr:V-type ATP synthase subunit D [Clostridia bacterium]